MCVLSCGTLALLLCDRVEQRVLTTERVLGDKWLVTGGLKAGDRVIVEGLQKIGPGAQVKPTEMVPEAPKTAEAK